ncbi:hypothetical protein SteCoe_25961 [Stentor coeruleus]|uniref:Uncharacterized protein n=1 Tax=Stentor coeruleus TaxID=5963 RepID=A0A1R2BE14_9CILI|nr:hypothetical protein SteCoe_25961 [Stentor coeruleus]
MHFQDDKPLPFERSLESTYGKTQHLQGLYDERIDSLSKQLQVFFSEIEKDEIFKAMQENPLSQEYAVQRAGELFIEVMQSEQEETIKRLENDLAEGKSLNSKLENDKQRLMIRVKDFEDENQRLLHECEGLKNKLLSVENQFDESLKRKDTEWMQKMDMNLRKIETTLQDTEEKYFTTKKELENVSNAKKNSDLIYNECECLKRELKNQETHFYRQQEDLKRELKTQETYFYRQQEDLKRNYDEKIIELNDKISIQMKNYDALSLQFKNYQKQSEDLAGNHQTLIKNLVDKSKQLKQKIISQKGKLSDYSKLSKESSTNIENIRSNYNRTISELEDKIRTIEKESSQKETELISKQQLQLSQLQQQYQQMMDAKLSEMQKEVNEQIIRSQEHDKEVKNIMDIKMREIDRDYMTKLIHEKIVADREILLVKKFNIKIEELNQKNYDEQESLKRQISELTREKQDLYENIEVSQKSEDNYKREILREKEKFNTDLTNKLNKIKEIDTARQELSHELDKTKVELSELKTHYESEVSNRITSEKEFTNLNNTLNELKSVLNQTKQSFQTSKTQHELTISDKIEKINFLERDLEIKSKTIIRYEEEISILQNSLKDSKLQQSGNMTMFDLEQSRHNETKKKLKELEEYSHKLIGEIDFRKTKQNEYNETVGEYKEQIRSLSMVIENKEQELFSFKQNFVNKENEYKQKLRLISERCKKHVSNSVFFLKKQLGGIVELYEHEYASIDKSFVTVQQEISIKILELQVQYRKQLDAKANEITENIRDFYRARLGQIEDYISQENVHWTDAETEGIRRAVKSILEKKHIGQVEIKSLRDTVANLGQQNESLYRENQKLQIRLHANNEAFDQLQREVTEEANKIKMRLEAGTMKERENSSARSFYRKLA